MSRRWMIVADGAGDYEDYFTVCFLEANSAQEAAELAVSPAMGYGKRDGGTVYVVPAEKALSFVTALRTTVGVSPADSEAVAADRTPE